MTDTAIIEAMARAMRERAGEARDEDPMLLEEISGWMEDEGFVALATAALAALREMEGRDG